MPRPSSVTGPTYQSHLMFTSAINPHRSRIPKIIKNYSILIENETSSTIPRMFRVIQGIDTGPETSAAASCATPNDPR